MIRKLSVNTIQTLGFEWPKYALIKEYCVIEDNKVEPLRNARKNAVKSSLLPKTTQ